MGAAELRSNLHKIVDSIEDERLLRAIYSFLNTRAGAKEGRMWDSLSVEEKQEVLQAYDESEDRSSMVDDDEVWKNIK